MIYLLYGQPGAGKTSLGRLLATHLDTPFIIDGDEFRDMFANTNYGREGREENIRNANAVATYLSKKKSEGDWMCLYRRDGENSIHGHPISHQTDIVMSLVNPYDRLRKALRENNEGQTVEVLLTSDRELRKEYHVEDFERGTPDYEINTDKDVETTWRELKQLLNEHE